MKKILNRKYIFNIFFLLAFFSIIIYAHETGIVGRTLKTDQMGCFCHGTNSSSNVIVSINGPDTLLPNETGNYTLTISGGPLVRGGTDIAANAGKLNIVSNDLQLIGNELTHTIPKAPVNGVVTFEFTYTAPSTAGAITLFANGNSVNFNSQNTGDQWNFAPNKTINIMQPTSVEDENIIYSFKLQQNYPNPFNPSTKIKYTVPAVETQHAAFVQLKIYDILGKEIATLVNKEQAPGNYNVNFDASGLTSGVYFYELKVVSAQSHAGAFSKIKKMILLR